MEESDKIVEAAKTRKKRLAVMGDREKHLSMPKKRNHGKRHSVNKEKSYEAREKHRKAQLKITENDKQHRHIKDLTRAYWNGEIDEHP